MDEWGVTLSLSRLSRCAVDNFIMNLRWLYVLCFWLLPVLAQAATLAEGEAALARGDQATAAGVFMALASRSDGVGLAAKRHLAALATRATDRITWYQRMIDAHGAFRDRDLTLVRLAELHLLLGAPAQALDPCREVFRSMTQSPYRPQAMLIAARAFMQLNDMESARFYLEPLPRMYPHAPERWWAVLAHAQTYVFEDPVAYRQRLQALVSQAPDHPARISAQALLNQSTGAARATPTSSPESLAQGQGSRPPSGAFVVQVGVYRDAAIAESIQTRLSGLGFNTLLVHTELSGRPALRLLLSGFATRTAAQAALNRLESAGYEGFIRSAG